MPTLKYVKLVGTGLGENLDVFAQSFKHPSIIGLDLQLNGLTKNVLTACFKHVVNFDVLEELDLSSSWFGVDGLYEVKDEFLRFKKLRVLRLGINKLCLCHQDDRSLSKKLGEVIPNFQTVEELDLQENSINDNKFMDLYPALASLKKLKHLNLQHNQITNRGFQRFFLSIVNRCGNGRDMSDPAYTGPSQLAVADKLEACQLQVCNFNNNLLKDDGFQTLIMTYWAHPVIF